MFVGQLGTPGRLFVARYMHPSHVEGFTVSIFLGRTYKAISSQSLLNDQFPRRLCHWVNYDWVLYAEC